MERRAQVNVTSIPKFVDNKRKHMEKGLSQAQRDHLLLQQGKEDAKLKQQMVEAFDGSNQTLERSITKMTNCLTSLGEGIGSGMQMLAMALSGTAPQVHPSCTQQLQAHSPQIPTPQAQPRHYTSYTPNFTNTATVYPNPL